MFIQISICLTDLPPAVLTYSTVHNEFNTVTKDDTLSTWKFPLVYPSIRTVLFTARARPLTRPSIPLVLVRRHRPTPPAASPPHHRPLPATRWRRWPPWPPATTSRPTTRPNSPTLPTSTTTSTTTHPSARRWSPTGRGEPRSPTDASSDWQLF